MVPGLVGDQDTAQWNLAMKAHPDSGDELVYPDEQGGELRVRLVGTLPVRKSVLQGSILIAEDVFTARFPSHSGYRAFLMDRAEPGAGEPLEDRYADLGLVVQGAEERLRMFWAVEHGYLAIFLALGGLGLLLASLGMGVVVLRNMAERREEHALLLTLGFPRGTIGRLVLLEHAGIFAAGVIGGSAAALLAVAPMLAEPGAGAW